MSAVWVLAAYTLRETLGFAVVRIILGLAALLPLAAWIFSGFFLLEIAKVQLDVMTAGAYFLGITLIITSVVQLLGADIEGRLCYFYIIPPVRRVHYVLGRFLGCVLLLLILTGIIFVGSEALIALGINTLAEPWRHGIGYDVGLVLAWTSCYQSITILAAVFFIAAWATGFAELLFFSIAACVLFWIFPPVLTAMSTPALIKDIPEWVISMIHAIDWFLPEMTAGQFILAYEHGEKLALNQFLLHMGGHFGYMILMMVLCVILFNRRDL